MKHALMWMALLYGCVPNAGKRAAVRGETNGQTFDLVAEVGEHEEWTLRLRGDELWAGHLLDGKTTERAAQALSSAEAALLWQLIDELNIPGRKRRDGEGNAWLFRLRVPTGGGPHKVYTTEVPRDTTDEAVLDVIEQLEAIVNSTPNGQPEIEL